MAVRPEPDRARRRESIPSPAPKIKEGFVPSFIFILIGEGNRRFGLEWLPKWQSDPNLTEPAGESRSCLPHHKETIILIRKISVLWLFYYQNGGILLFCIGFRACRDGFCPCKSLFLAVKYIVYFMPNSFAVWGIVQFIYAYWQILNFQRYTMFSHWLCQIMCYNKLSDP